MSGDNSENFSTGYNTGIVSDPVSEAGARSRQLQEELNQPTVPVGGGDPALRVDVRELAGDSLISRILTGAVIPEIFEAIGIAAEILLGLRATFYLALVLAAGMAIVAATSDVSAALGLTIPYETAVLAGAGFMLPYLLLAILRQVARGLEILSHGLLNLAYSLAYMAFLFCLLAGAGYLVWILVRAT